MSSLLTFCVGWIVVGLVFGVAVGKVLARNRSDDESVSEDWRRQHTAASYRNQFDGVSWTWPVKK